jgi:hypothetical protein
MKNLLYVLVFFICYPLIAQEADNSYVMYQSIHITPKSDHGPQLRAGLKAHNDKFHKKGSQQVNVWAINSGPRSGSMLWIKGPLTWTDMDRDLNANGHMDDWNKNVTPHCQMGQMEFWRLMNGMSYAPDGFNPKIMVARYFDIHNQKWDNARNSWETIFKVYNEKKYNMGLQIYANQANAGDGRDWCVIWFYDSWASMDKDRNFWDSYKETNNMDRREYFERWTSMADFKGMEIFSLIPELSMAPTNQ